MKKIQFVGSLDPILDSKARPLTLEEIRSESMQSFFDAMLAFARGEQSNSQSSVLVGLAAPQVGVSLRIILVDVEANGKGSVARLNLYINPTIISMSDEQEEWYEACYSTDNVRGVVMRPKFITVEAIDRMGNPVKETHQGYVARIFQHEIDHLDGLRFPERIPHDGVLHDVDSGEIYEYRNLEKWRTWQKCFPKSEWRQRLIG